MKNSTIYIIVGAVFGLSFLFSIMAMIKNKKRVSGYLEKYPDAVKVHLKAKYYGIANNSVNILSIDGEAPYLFVGGFYAKPGKSTIIVNYESERIGVIHKTVKKSTGDIPLEVDLEAGKEYQLSFNTDTGEFSIVEL